MNRPSIPPTLARKSTPPYSSFLCEDMNWNSLKKNCICVILVFENLQQKDDVCTCGDVQYNESNLASGLAAKHQQFSSKNSLDYSYIKASSSLKDYMESTPSARTILLKILTFRPLPGKCCRLGGAWENQSLPGSPQRCTPTWCRLECSRRIGHVFLL